MLRATHPVTPAWIHAIRAAALLLELHREGMRTEDVQVLYAQHVLGYSIAELSAMTGRDRRALYARRDRGRERLSA